MKKAILVIVIILFSANLFAAETVVKFYLQDGSSKQYKISEIGNFDFIKSNLSFEMRIHCNDTKLIYKYDIRKIEKIQFDVDIVRIFIESALVDYKLNNIDSIIFVWNTCQEIQIGTQIWMCKNLDVDHYRNGDSIPEVRDSAAWANLKTGAWCYYNNDPMFYSKYGKLYNWYAVNDPRGLAPEGWHVPSDDEWKELELYLGMSKTQVDSIMWRGSNEGGKLKETGTINWSKINEGATNESGFTALCVMSRSWDGYFGNYLGCSRTWWWTSTEDVNIWMTSWSRSLQSGYNKIFRLRFHHGFGFSVRCIKD